MPHNYRNTKLGEKSPLWFAWNPEESWSGMKIVLEIKEGP
jgi:hypothetical protein